MWDDCTFRICNNLESVKMYMMPFEMLPSKSVTTFQKGETLRCKQTEFLSKSYKANKTDSKTPSIITKFQKYVVLQAKNKRANQQHQSKQTKLSFRPYVFIQPRGANVLFSASSDVY